jgi:hypothetical protein
MEDGNEVKDGAKREARADMAVEALNHLDEVDDGADSSELAELDAMGRRRLQHSFPFPLILPSYLVFRIVFIDLWVGTDRQ